MVEEGEDYEEEFNPYHQDEVYDYFDEVTKNTRIRHGNDVTSAWACARSACIRINIEFLRYRDGHNEMCNSVQ